MAICWTDEDATDLRHFIANKGEHLRCSVSGEPAQVPFWYWAGQGGVPIIVNAIEAREGMLLDLVMLLHASKKRNIDEERRLMARRLMRGLPEDKA